MVKMRVMDLFSDIQEILVSKEDHPSNRYCGKENGFEVGHEFGESVLPEEEVLRSSRSSQLQSSRLRHPFSKPRNKGHPPVSLPRQVRQVFDAYTVNDLSQVS
jgi:hypothetical protein